MDELFLVIKAQISSMKVALVVKDFLRGFWVVIVAQHHVVQLETQFSFFATPDWYTGVGLYYLKLFLD